jgi:S1-C subfamily serine protease
MMRFNADDAVILQEIGAVIVKEGDKINVMMVPPPDAGPAGREVVDLKAGDEVGMANGKRVKAIGDLRTAYEATKPGEEFKLGIRRDGKAQIVTFTRKDAKDMPQGGRMIVREEGGNPNEDVFPALGFGIVTKEGTTTVNMLLPNAPKQIAEGDEVLSMNGKKVTKAADFSDGLDATKIGDELTMEFSHGGKAYTVKMKRPEPQGMKMIRREK